MASAPRWAAAFWGCTATPPSQRSLNSGNDSLAPTFKAVETALAQCTSLTGGAALPDLNAAAEWIIANPAREQAGMPDNPLAEFAELPPTVEWSGGRYHAPAANLWAHCVRDEAP